MDCLGNYSGSTILTSSTAATNMTKTYQPHESLEQASHPLSCNEESLLLGSSTTCQATTDSNNSQKFVDSDNKMELKGSPGPTDSNPQSSQLAYGINALCLIQVLQNKI